MKFINFCEGGLTLRRAYGTIILAILLMAESAGASIWTVNAAGGGDYSKIQDAIDNASAGDTILVYGGTYYENVNVDKLLTLRGFGMPVVYARKSGNVITLSANGITIEGFSATRGGFQMEAGIKVNSKGNVLSGNNASNNIIGILLDPSSNNNTLSGNNASNNYYGIFLNSSINNTLSGNIANSNDYNGVILESSSNNTVSSNNASFNSYGILLSSSSNNTLSSNTVESNRKFGIDLYLSSNNMLNGNNASNNYHGFSLVSSSNNMLSGNNASNNYRAIYLVTSSNNIPSNNNTIYNNYFYNSIAIDYGNNRWNITKTPAVNIIGGKNIGGNYWANPGGTGFSQTCRDMDKDEICDSIYFFDPYNPNNTDFLPLASPTKVTDPSASHEIPDDTDNEPLWGETAQLNATVTDDGGIRSVTVDLSDIGGPAAKPMINIGDNIWSTTTNAVAGTPPYVYELPLNATDKAGNSNTDVSIMLRIMKNGDTTGNGKVNIGDALLCANNVSFPGNPTYLLKSIYVADVTGNGIINIGDCLRLANRVAFPSNPLYILK